MVEALQENNPVPVVRAEARDTATLSGIDTQVDAFARPLVSEHGNRFTDKTYLPANRVQPTKNAIISTREFNDVVNKCLEILRESHLQQEG